MISFPRVLILDDDLNFMNHLESSLKNQYSLYKSCTVKQALEIITLHQIEVVLLDYKLTNETGLDLMDYLNSTASNLPVIVHSGFVCVDMAVSFLKRRPFDFLEKPASSLEVKEVLARAVQFCRSNTTAHQDSSQFTVKYETQTVLFKNHEVILTNTEFQILVYFIENRNKKVTRDQLKNFIWGKNTVSKHTLDTHLLNLKRKIPPFREKLISIYGIGYCYEN